MRKKAKHFNKFLFAKLFNHVDARSLPKNCRDVWRQLWFYSIWPDATVAISTHFLADDLAVSERTARRCLKTLRDHGSIKELRRGGPNVGPTLYKLVAATPAATERIRAMGLGEAIDYASSTKDLGHLVRYLSQINGAPATGYE